MYRASLGTRGESRRQAAEAESAVIGRVRRWERKTGPAPLAPHVIIPQWVRGERPPPPPSPKPAPPTPPAPAAEAPEAAIAPSAADTEMVNAAPAAEPVAGAAGDEPVLPEASEAPPEASEAPPANAAMLGELAQEAEPVVEHAEMENAPATADDAIPDIAQAVVPTQAGDDAQASETMPVEQAPPVELGVPDVDGGDGGDAVDAVEATGATATLAIPADVGGLPQAEDTAQDTAAVEMGATPVEDVAPIVAPMELDTGVRIDAEFATAGPSDLAAVEDSANPPDIADIAPDAPMLGDDSIPQ